MSLKYQWQRNDYKLVWRSSHDRDIVVANSWRAVYNSKNDTVVVKVLRYLLNFFTTATYDIDSMSHVSLTFFNEFYN